MISFTKMPETFTGLIICLYEEGILEQHSASGSTGIGKEIKNMFPEVEGYTRFSRSESSCKIQG